jgi:L-Ala-D/L-Glu epimerase
MMQTEALGIAAIEAWPVQLPLHAPFVVASGSMSVAHNIFIKLTLKSGTCGYGEMAPFPDISGEDQAACLAAFPAAARCILGQSVWNWRKLAHQLAEVAREMPSVRCGLETAFLDALCREMAIPMWALWGGADVRPRETDITLPIGETEQVVCKAKEWFIQGFRVFKVKVGQDVDADIQRIEAVFKAFPEAAFVIDANQGFTVSEALQFIESISRMAIPVLLLEQPVHRDNREGLAAVRRDSPFPIAADESVRSLHDAELLIREKAVDVMNIKITKCGVVESGEIARLAKSCGLQLMIGGMVESRVAMGCSFSMAMGLGGFGFLDLDMPLLLAIDPVRGGYAYKGPVLQPWEESGLGMEMSQEPSSVILVE